jgi:hypothetical protein
MAAEFAQLKGQMVAIEQASIQKKCGIQFQQAARNKKALAANARRPL